MRLLAIDFGTKKCGIAISDPLKIISQPLCVIFYEENNYKMLINELDNIIYKNQPIEKIILGITKNIDGSLSPTSKLILKFQKELINYYKNIEIVLFDEKYTTSEANKIMKEMKISKKNKKNKEDAIAAQKILENYMEHIKIYK